MAPSYRYNALNPNPALPIAQGIVVFAHGSGSSRMSPRNRMVAKMLQDAGSFLA